MSEITAKFPNGKFYSFTETDSVQHAHSGICHVAGTTAKGQRVLAAHSNLAGSNWGAQFVTEEEYIQFLEEIQGDAEFQTLDRMYEKAMYGE